MSRITLGTCSLGAVVVRVVFVDTTVGGAAAVPRRVITTVRFLDAGRYMTYLRREPRFAREHCVVLLLSAQCKSPVAPTSTTSSMMWNREGGDGLAVLLRRAALKWTPRGKKDEDLEKNCGRKNQADWEDLELTQLARPRLCWLCWHLTPQRERTGLNG